VIAARTVTVFAGVFLGFVARIVQKYFPHYGLGKFFKGGSVAGFANFRADVGCRLRLGRRFLRGPTDCYRYEEENTGINRRDQPLHVSSAHP
jgi:hypothetical protein